MAKNSPELNLWKAQKSFLSQLCVAHLAILPCLYALSFNPLLLLDQALLLEHNNKYYKSESDPPPETQ